MRLLKMIGFVSLYIVVWLVTQLISAVVIAVPMMLYMILQGKEPSFENIMVSGVSWILILSSIMATVIFWLIYLIREKNFIQELNIRALPKLQLQMSILAGVGISLILNGIMILVDIGKYFPEASKELAEMFSESNLLPLLVAVGIVVPIFEELMFRGIIFNEMKKVVPIWLAVVMSGVVFGLAHMNPIQIIYTVPAGMLLAVLYLRTGSLWTPIIIHMAWNLSSILTGAFTSGSSTSGLLIMILLGLGLMFISTKELWGYKPPGPPDPDLQLSSEHAIHIPAPPPSQDLVL